MFNARHKSRQAVRPVRVAMVAGSGLVLALVLAVLMAATAHALTVSVVNDRGVPQSGTRVALGSGYYLGTTDGNGQAQISSSFAVAGETIYATRQSSSGACGSAPEGSPGSAATIPTPMPATMTITVPSTGLNPYQPQLSDGERGLVGLINQQRTSEGKGQLLIAQTLTAASDSYVAVLPENYSGITSEQAHCSHFGPLVRVLDAGFPLNAGAATGENIAWTNSARATFAGWLNSPDHRAAMLNANANVIGVANAGNKWIINLGHITPGEAGYARAGVTADAGDPALAPLAAEEANGEAGADADQQLRDPNLQLAATRQGKKITARVRAASKATAQGRITLTAFQGRKRRVLELRGNGLATARLSAGRWRLVAKYVPRGASEYLVATSSRAVSVPRARR